MGTGDSGIYYSSHGSRLVGFRALIHSFDGKFTYDIKGKLSRMKSGGHGQSNIDFLRRNGANVEITKTYANGVRVGNVSIHSNKIKREGEGQTWFPKNWKQKDMTRAGEHVAKLKENRHVKDGVAVYGMYKGVRVGIIKTNGKIATIFPDKYQPITKKGKRKR